MPGGVAVAANADAVAPDVAVVVAGVGVVADFAGARGKGGAVAG